MSSLFDPQTRLDKASVPYYVGRFFELLTKDMVKGEDVWDHSQSGDVIAKGVTYEVKSAAWNRFVIHAHQLERDPHQVYALWRWRSRRFRYPGESRRKPMYELYPTVQEMWNYLARNIVYGVFVPAQVLTEVVASLKLYTYGKNQGWRDVYFLPFTRLEKLLNIANRKAFEAAFDMTIVTTEKKGCQIDHKPEYFRRLSRVQVYTIKERQAA